MKMLSARSGRPRSMTMLVAKSPTEAVASMHEAMKSSSWPMFYKLWFDQEAPPQSIHALYYTALLCKAIFHALAQANGDAGEALHAMLAAGWTGQAMG